MSTRILIVDDHAVVRKGLRLVLEDDLEPVGEAGSARDAIFQARALKPDVILLDVVMPEKSGLEVLPRLKHEHPDVKVLVLSIAGRPAVRPRGVRGRRQRLRPQGIRGHRGRRRRPRRGGRRPLRPPGARGPA
jgi:DNA-binding NarL/FixJ family response regulator